MRASLWKDRSAATSIEYGMVAAVIAIGLLLGASKLRDLVSGSLEQLAGGGSSMKVQSCPAGETCDARGQGSVKNGSSGQNGGQSVGVGVR